MDTVIKGRMRFLAAVGMAVVLAAGIGTTGARAHGTPDQPDFEGVWLGFAAKPMGRLGPEIPPLSEEGKKIVQAFDDKYGGNLPEPGAYCVPSGMPRVMTSLAGYPIEIVQSPDQVTILAELETQFRRIYTDGRDHPEGYPRTRMGHSVGHWEDDTLVVDTRLLKEWPIGQTPRSKKAHMTERIYLSDRQTLGLKGRGFTGIEPLSDAVLVDELTIHDPVMFDEPVEVTIYFQPVPDTVLLEYDCAVDLWQRALELNAEGKPDLIEQTAD